MIMIYPSEITKKWPHRPLSEVVDFLDSKRKPITQKDRVPGPYPYYGANGQQDSVADYIFDEPLVLLAEDGGHFGDADKTIAYQVEGKCWVNNHAHVLRPKKDVDIRYICRHLERYDVTPFITGSTRGKLTKTAANNIPIALPPLEEQQRIAAILDKADGVRRKRKEAIRLTEELLRSTFLEMFGDPVTNPKGWEIVKLGSLVVGQLNNGIFKKNHEYGGDTPVVWVKELFSGYTIDCSESRTLTPTDEEVKKFGLTKGDILFCRSSLNREGIGFNNVFDGMDFSALFECHIIRVSLNQRKVNSIFLNYLLRFPGLRKQIIAKANTVTMSTIGQSEIKKIEFYLPPKELQDKFEIFLRKIATNRTKLENKESENLFNSLLQRAFRGEL
jgi:type I restriction enzyme S subunit